MVIYGAISSVHQRGRSPAGLEIEAYLSLPCFRMVAQL